MHLHLHHRTVCAYDRPVDHSIQMLRLTPRVRAGVEATPWRVASARVRRLATWTDGFGNVVHLHVVREPHVRVTINAEGVVETHDTTGLVQDAAEPLPPAFYLRATPLTTPDPRVEALAADAAGASDVLCRLHRLLGLVHDRLAHRPGVAYAGGTAAQALAEGTGVCQDHAHVFVTAARALGIPARYVGGWLCAGTGNGGSRAGHAWAEAHHPELGWIGFDPASGVCPGERHVACAIGLDYFDAAPVRCVRQAPGVEDVTMQMTVAELQEQ